VPYFGGGGQLVGSLPSSFGATLVKGKFSSVNVLTVSCVVFNSVLTWLSILTKCDTNLLCSLIRLMIFVKARRNLNVRDDGVLIQLLILWTLSIFFFLLTNVSETTLPPSSERKRTHLGTIDRAVPYLRAPESTNRTMSMSRNSIIVEIRY
jgi:hypothetical protein